MAICKIRLVSEKQETHDLFVEKLQESFQTTVFADPTKPFKYGKGLVTYMVLDVED